MADRFVHKFTSVDKTDIERRLKIAEGWKDKIDQVCNQRQWSLSEFCRFAQVDVPMLSRVINRAAPSQETIEKIEKALKKVKRK